MQIDYDSEDVESTAPLRGTRSMSRTRSKQPVSYKHIDVESEPEAEAEEYV